MKDFRKQIISLLTRYNAYDFTIVDKRNGAIVYFSHHKKRFGLHVHGANKNIGECVLGNFERDLKRAANGHLDQYAK